MGNYVIPEKKKEGEDIRQTCLRELVNDIFGVLSVSIEKSDINTEIVLGRKKDFTDCSFKVTYRVRYEDLFNLTFTHKQCKFKYVGKQKKGYTFNRDIAVNNAVAFFKKKGVDIDYIFHSQAEQYLFSKLLYKYISMLIGVLFEDFDCLGSARNNLFKKKYDEVFRKIRKEVKSNDIIDLIYNVANISDIEQVIDERYDITECKIAYLIDTSNFQDGFSGLKNEVICNMKDYDSAIASNIVMNKAGMKYQIFPFKKNSRFSVEKDTHILSLRIWENICREIYCPRYFWYITKNTGYDSNSEEETYLYDYRFNRSKAEILGAAIRALEKKYFYDKRARYLQWMNSLNAVLERVYTENYDLYFSIDKAQKSKKDRYNNLKSFLKDNTIDGLDPKIIYIYLVSVAIDNLCEKLNFFNHEEMKKYISKDDKAYKQHCKYLKEICDSKNLETAINKYTAFYNDNKSVIYAFAQKVEISKISCDETLLSTEYNPYLFLKNSLQRYYKCLCNTQQEPFIYFDIGSSSIESSDDNNKGILYFENGKNYRIEFEACGCSDDPFSFIIINKKTDGTLVSVFDKSDIILTSDMQKYTFEFCYNGSDDDMCFLTFGYGTFLRGFKLQNFSIFEIQ
ncbi:hypothetical protein [Ruminococcus flavefaciens]|uniref:Uncharacterized protein n=1 Tax=Ruminococcus flavefaciens TaxID=1265 RepID=A0A315XY94_RUMFL|nr:hypothetical protein [Ruminococcus flavefaciens]PWJ12263.1 hypothetical protein IE37_01953 [Ruminococcus flavefaciens]SSA49753.1 hypothetical protein SAMN02910325_01953 [Ruminococcus flavefaciens]